MSVGRTSKKFNQNIYLIGFMGAGKSTVGRILSRKLHRQFLDTDALIEKKLNKSVANIFLEKGEPFFREIESEIVQEVALSDSKVIALGGGAILCRENWQRIRNSGVTVYLKWDIKHLIPRIIGDKSRPLVREMAGSPLKREMEKLLLERAAFYENADITLKCENSLPPEQIADRIIRALQETR
jgi:shikimate kinase